jgi:hypothetical protein
VIQTNPITEESELGIPQYPIETVGAATREFLTGTLACLDAVLEKFDRTGPRLAAKEQRRRVQRPSPSLLRSSPRGPSAKRSADACENTLKLASARITRRRDAASAPVTEASYS